MWANESVFYHIYPLGFCGCEERNDFSKNDFGRIKKIESWIDHMKYLGTNALYLGPVFESSMHGYDTSDYFKIDSRLGSNQDFKEVCASLHDSGIKIVLDGVFNHVGRDFWAFRDVLQNRENSPFCDWFCINFNGNNCYNDGLSYEGWEGCYDLVRLNLRNSNVKDHIFHAIKTWVEDYDIDGLRLDVAYCLDKDFLRELRVFCKSLKEDFWLMGETLHGDYNQWMNEEMLDSVTNYECYKGLHSSINSKNMFEISHSLQRQFSSEGHSIYKNKNLYSFLDNHDVSRISTVLKDKRHLKMLYTMLFSMPGIPSVYYGSEWALEGEKNKGDKDLRPCLQMHQGNDLVDHISRLSSLKKDIKALSYGSYRQLQLTNEACSFVREYEDHSALAAFNMSDKSFIVKYDDFETEISPFSSHIFHDGMCVFSSKV